MSSQILLLLFIGLLNLGLGATGTFNQAVAVKYVKTSPKAYLWRKLLGEERAIWAVQRVFAPFAMFLGVVVLTFALLTVVASL